MKNDVSNLKEDKWEAPDISKLNFQFDIGNSFIEEFVLSHNLSAVLKELVQNEYDANGKKIEVYFGRDSLSVIGSGNPIDAKGWQRLSVLIGTGTSTLSKKNIKPKVNGIGSKNFGLRTLFLFGDTIYISSKGKQTILDITKGALSKPIEVKSSKHKRGVSIKVLYRTEKRNKLVPFSLKHEQEALDKFGSELSHTLIKLSQPDSLKNLKEVSVNSERCKRQFTWKQTNKILNCKLKGVTILERKIRMFDSQTSKTQVIEEIEFQNVVVLPSEFKEKNIPNYFRIKGGRIRLALSFRLNKGKIDVNQPGLFYYPIGINNGYTGTALSICAPFQMDIDRSQLIDPEIDEFNAWLLKTVADLTIKLLIEDWYYRFGFTIYNALIKNNQPSISFYIDQLNSKLKESECWATRKNQQKGGNKTLFVSVKKAVIPEDTYLDNLLSNNCYLDKNIWEDVLLRQKVIEYGSPLFTVNSLVRLLCAGANSEQLKTKLLNNEASYSYKDYNLSLSNESRQLKFAKALDSRKSLTPSHLEDIKNSKSTLTASGELDSITELWLVDPRLAFVCPIPLPKRLHSSLLPYKIYKKLGKTFKVTTWINDIIEKIHNNHFNEESRRALYEYIISEYKNLNRKIVASLRDEPILLDHLGNWVKPSSIIVRKANAAKQLKKILHFPHPDFEHNQELAELLNFRKGITGEDLVKYAHTIESSPKEAVKFENLLSKYDYLLTKTVISQLKEIRFLQSTKGTIAKPSSLYIQNQVNQTCMGLSALYPSGLKTELYKKLGCIERPKEEDIINYIQELKIKNQKPLNPDILYKELIKAISRYPLDSDYYKDEAILWTGNNYSCPEDILLGSYHRKIFQDSVPIISDNFNSLFETYQMLGANKKPQLLHWRNFFLWIDQKYRDSGNKLSDSEKNSLREAYSQMMYLPTLPSNIKWFLDRNGNLHDLAKIQTDSFIIDDDPHLSAQIEKLGLSIAFADIYREETLGFYEDVAKVKRLTNIYHSIDTQIDGEKMSSSSIRQDRVIRKLHNDYFISAIKKIAGHTLKSKSEITLAKLKIKLNSIKKIVFADAIYRKYFIKSNIVSVSIRAVFYKNQIVCTDVKNQNDLYDVLSQLIAELFTGVVSERRILSDPIYRLLLTKSASEIQKYLNQKGILWEPQFIDDFEELDFMIDSEADVSEQLENLLAEMSQDLVQQPELGSSPKGTSTTAPQKDSWQEQSSQLSEVELPPIENVSPRFTKNSGELKQHTRRKKTGVSGGGRSSTSPNTKRDQIVGRRGEDLVYMEELNRVKELGYDGSQVIKTYEINPFADHDIRSVNENGEEIWIEVKSTTGKSGRFNWSKAEFEKALKERKNYILWRVYEADTTTPSYKVYKDPIGLLLKHQMLIDIGGFYAEVDSLDS